jgi:hypothetical protein
MTVSVRCVLRVVEDLFRLQVLKAAGQLPTPNVCVWRAPLNADSPASARRRVQQVNASQQNSSIGLDGSSAAAGRYLSPGEASAGGR